jgi:hypothetical protein
MSIFGFDRLTELIREGLRNAVAGTDLVCFGCLRPDDTVTGDAGDFSCCHRCQASITSKTGKTIRRASATDNSNSNQEE